MPKDENPYDTLKVDDVVQRVIDKIDFTSIVTAAIRESQHAAIPEQVAAAVTHAPRAWTADETAEKIVKHCAGMAEYWATNPACGTLEERVHGAAFSILSGLDGSSMNIPAFDLVPSPAEDDANYHIENGENYYDPNNVVSTTLHERYHRIKKEMFPKYDQNNEHRRHELKPDEMRELFVRAAYDIAWKTAMHVPNKREACEGTARQIMQLLDGVHDDYDCFPPFIVTAAPSPALNQHALEQVEYTWGTHIPVSRQAPVYGITDSLTDDFDRVRARSQESARNMFGR